MKVLIADDSTMVRQRLRDMVSQEPSVEEVLEAGGGEEVLELARTEMPNVVFLDIRMPDKTGTEILPDLRALLPAAKIIVLTNYPYPPYRKRCMKDGADFFFDKTNDFEQAVEVLKRLAVNGDATNGKGKSVVYERLLNRSANGQK